MSDIYIDGKDFIDQDFSEYSLALGEYEDCHFSRCVFANTDLSNFKFLDCTFTDCDWSTVNLNDTMLQDCQFKSCKMIGLHFEDCYKLVFSVSFDQCLLNLSSFQSRNLSKMQFKECSLQEVDFTATDLSQAIFKQCDLSGSTFEDTILFKADFRSSVGYSIDPDKNDIRKAKFSLPGVLGLLDKYDIWVEGKG